MKYQRMEQLLVVDLLIFYQRKSYCAITLNFNNSHFSLHSDCFTFQRICTTNAQHTRIY